MEISPRKMDMLVKRCHLDFFEPGDTVTLQDVMYQCHFPWYWRVFFQLRSLIGKVMTNTEEVEDDSKLA